MAGIGYLLVFAVAMYGSNFLLTRLGLQVFLFVLIGSTFGLIYGLISFRNLAIPFYILILSVGALRFIWSIKAPLLPDLYFDRITLIWLTTVFMIVYFANRWQMKRPWTLDWFILAHGSYILLRIYMGDMVHFHTWTMSVLTPYLVYFFAKNIIQTQSQIRILMMILLALSIYYTITSIAEKFSIPWLLYPREMIWPHPEFHGRSCGPFRNSGIFGNAVGMLLPVHLYFIATVNRRALKLLLALSMALGFAALYFTYTRGSWLSGIACLVTVAFFNRRSYLKTLVPLLVIVPFFSLFFLNVGQDKFMKERVENDDTIGSRVGTMITTLRVWQDYPILGCGSYQFRDFREHYIEPIDVPILGTIRFAQFRHNSAHDMFLGPLAEDGLIGMGLQLTIYFLIIRAMLIKLKYRKYGDHVATYVIPIFLGIAASYLVGGVTISYRHSSILGALFYMCAGIAYGYQPEAADDKKISADHTQGGS